MIEMASEDLEISLHLDIDRLQQTFMEKDFADAFLFDALTSVLFGQIRVSCSGHERAAIDNERLLVNLKRVWKRKSTSPQNGPPGRKTMRLIEPIAPCAMCSYIATQKHSLKTHYKLKHLGGGDLVMTCQICKVKLKTKGYMKKHYMTVHKLDDNVAQNMVNSQTDK
ncbi:uncharacterized protein LOC142354362 isoform X2 [Convolutriloba macropyga]|uniref:uncharacterized protein LOC142354362 isoform X2 n=1 Tax=Convolutriloba macropyga TaxID=536237 RepID=UPI003F51F02D